MPVVENEFKNDVSKYLSLASRKDIFIVSNNNCMFKISKVNNELNKKTQQEILDSLVGCIPQTMTYEEAKRKRVEDI